MIDPAPEEEAVQRPDLGQVALVAFLAVGVLFLTVGASAQVFNLAWGLWFSEAFVFLAVPFLALAVTGRRPWRATGLDQPAWGMAAGVGVGLFNYAAWAVPLMWLAEQLFPPEVVERYSAARLFDRQSGVELVLLIAGVGVAAPFCEEFFYRGLVQPGLARRVPAARALVISALLFSLMHFDPVGFLARFELGLVFGLLAWRSGSLWPAIGAHAANNLISVIVFFVVGDGTGLPGWLIGALALGGNVGVVALVVVLRRARWWVAPVPAADEVAPFAPFFRAVAPWMVGALAALIGLTVVDRRGVQLNIIDLMNPVKRPGKDASAGERQAWQDLQELRARVRAGEGGFDEYRALRELAGEKPPAE
ncbi:MAG: CPBP family intramembrane metalloprotease [Myxococcaceae bacterium]|nr:CPBP family intramembrane metalloprotease [Myxococcaceae bacterium]